MICSASGPAGNARGEGPHQRVGTGMEGLERARPSAAARPRRDGLRISACLCLDVRLPDVLLRPHAAGGRRGGLSLPGVTGEPRPRGRGYALSAYIRNPIVGSPRSGREGRPWGAPTPHPPSRSGLARSGWFGLRSGGVRHTEGAYRSSTPLLEYAPRCLLCAGVRRGRRLYETFARGGSDAAPSLTVGARSLRVVGYRTVIAALVMTGVPRSFVFASMRMVFPSLQ